MIEWIPHDDRCRVPPESVGYAVRAMKFPTSKSVAETDSHISIDYIPMGSGTYKLYHFTRVDNSWISCQWTDLSDDHRLVIRTRSQYKYAIGGYKDHRYYTLEALT